MANEILRLTVRASPTSKPGRKSDGRQAEVDGTNTEAVALSAECPRPTRDGHFPTRDGENRPA